MSILSIKVPLTSLANVRVHTARNAFLNVPPLVQLAMLSVDAAALIYQVRIVTELRKLPNYPDIYALFSVGRSLLIGLVHIRHGVPPCNALKSTVPEVHSTFVEIV